MISAPKNKGGKATLARVLAALPGSTTEIAAKANVSHQTAWRWLPYLVQCKLAYVKKTRAHPTGSRRELVYEAGPAPEGHKISYSVPKTEAQRSKAYRRRQKQDGSNEDRLAKERARYWAKRTPKRDALTNALFTPIGTKKGS